MSSRNSTFLTERTLSVTEVVTLVVDLMGNMSLTDLSRLILMAEVEIQYRQEQLDD